MSTAGRKPERLQQEEPFDARDKKSAEEMDERRKMERTRILDALRTVLGTREGRDLLYYIIGLGDPLSQSMTGNSWTNFYEGKRCVSINLIRDIEEADTTAFLRMQREELERQNNIRLPHFEDTEEDVTENSEEPATVAG
jgi:hypothetical protein